MRTLLTLVVGLLLFGGVLFGCKGGGEPSETDQSELLQIYGTTNRITANPVVQDDTDLFLKIFTRWEDCEYIGTTREEQRTCMPYVDRASGEVRLSFGLRSRDDNTPFPLPLMENHVRALHDGFHIKNASQTAYTLIPHNPIRAKQLFILVIDGSSSMTTPLPGATMSRMEEVQTALLSEDVQRSFFPGDVETAVTVVQFSKGRGRSFPTGDAIQILNRSEYVDTIRRLSVPGGFTNLYDAIQFASEDFLEEETVSRWLTLNNAEPTIVVLTDGFNNIQSTDLCRTNAAPLSNLLEHLQKMRLNFGASSPRVYTVGLGRPIRPNYEMPNQRGTDISPMELCDRFINEKIDRGLENQGIDNVSLEWIAAYGGGSSYVRQGHEKLGEAFAAAAAERFDWFEVRYRVPALSLRRRFVSAIELVSFATARAEVTIHPSAWMDAPPGVPAEDGWARPASYRQTLVIMLPLFGLIVTLMFYGAASFNTRRVLMGRTRPPRAPKGSAR